MAFSKIFVSSASLLGPIILNIVLEIIKTIDIIIRGKNYFKYLNNRPRDFFIFFVFCEATAPPPNLGIF